MCINQGQHPHKDTWCGTLEKWFIHPWDILVGYLDWSWIWGSSFSRQWHSCCLVQPGPLCLQEGDSETCGSREISSVPSIYCSWQHWNWISIFVKHTLAGNWTMLFLFCESSLQQCLNVTFPGKSLSIKVLEKACFLLTLKLNVPVILRSSVIWNSHLSAWSWGCVTWVFHFSGVLAS